MRHLKFENNKKMVADEDSRVKLRLVAEEVSFVRILASNEKRLRDRGVKRLRRFLIARSQRGGGKKLLHMSKINLTLHFYVLTENM